MSNRYERRRDHSTLSVGGGTTMAPAGVWICGDNETALAATDGSERDGNEGAVTTMDYGRRTTFSGIGVPDLAAACRQHRDKWQIEKDAFVSRC